MFGKAIGLAVLLSAMASAVQLEVVKLYQPISLHSTDGVGQELDGRAAIQATIFSRPVAISGAIPEDLVKAVAMPHKIPSNTPAYKVEDANLLNLCKVTLTTELKGDRLLVRLDVSELSIPKEIDLTSRQILTLSIRAIRRTLKEYYKEGEAEEAVEVSIGVIGTNEGTMALQDLAVRFKAGE